MLSPTPPCVYLPLPAGLLREQERERERKRESERGIATERQIQREEGKARIQE